MEYNLSSFPVQKLPLSQKDKEWREKCVDSIISREYGFSTRHVEMKIAYDLLNSKFDEKDLRYVTNPYKVEDGFPAKLQNINIIRPKIELLKGEETKRPDTFTVFQTDEAAVDLIQERKQQMLYQALTQSLQQENFGNLEEELAKIQSYISKDYYNPSERTAYLTLKYLREKLNLRDEFLKGWEDALVAGEEIYYTGIINGDPILERVNPLSFSYDRDPDLKNIEDGEWQLRRMRMTPAAVYDRFYDIMKEDDLDALLQEVKGLYSEIPNTGANVNTEYIVYKNITSPYGNWPYDEQYKGVFLNVWHAVWRSFKKVGFLTYEEDGEYITTIVDETYKKQEDETIVWDWIVENWEGYRIGRHLYLGIKPIEYQPVSIDNPNAKPLPYVGVVYNNNNTEGKSLVELLKPLQYMYIIIWYRLELALSRDKGKVLIMDVTQIPKSMGVDTNKWLHYLSAMGVSFVNPYEEGWDIPGREGGRPATFNQFSAVDMSMTNVIREYIELMNKLEEMIGELCGVTKQRQGQVQRDDLVGVVRQSIVQTSHITEPLFWRHSTAKKSAYTSLLNVAKHAWRMSGKKKLNYIFEGAERMFMDLEEDFLYSDYDVFISDSTFEQQNLETLRSLYQPAMQNGATLLDIASIMTSTNISEIKNKLKDIEDKREQMMQQQAQAEQQLKSQELQLKQEDNRIKEEDSIRRAETSIEVAQISAASKNNQSSNVDTTELQREKQNKDYEIKSRKLSEDERHNREQENISRIKKNSNTK